MEKCKNCKKEIENGYLLACPNCGATICPECAGATHQICPYCFSTLDYFI